MARLSLLREDVLEDADQLGLNDGRLDLLRELATHRVERLFAEFDRATQRAVEGLAFDVVATFHHEDLVAVADDAEGDRPGQGSAHQIPTTPRCWSSLRSNSARFATTRTAGAPVARS